VRFFSQISSTAAAIVSDTFSSAAHSIHSESSVMPYRLLITKHNRKAGSAHRRETHRHASLDHAVVDFGGEIVGGGDSRGNARWQATVSEVR
jgi:hypothetical protein